MSIHADQPTGEPSRQRPVAWPLGDMRLSPQAYAAYFETFKRYSNEYSAMIEWASATLAPDIEPGGRLSLLSVGCGAGDLDCDLARILAARCESLDFYGVEPNHAHVEEITHRMAAMNDERIGFDVVLERFEDFRTERAFDIVLFSQSLYYLADRWRAIERGLDLLTPNGRIVILHQTAIGINDLQRRFMGRAKGSTGEMFSSRELQDVLDQRALAYHVEVVDAHIDVSPCFEADSRDGEHLLSFFLEAPSHRLAPELRSEVLARLDEVSERDGARRAMPHPVAIFTIYEREARRRERDSLRHARRLTALALDD